MTEVRFVLHTGTTDRQGRLSLNLHITRKGHSCSYATGLWVDPLDWEEEKQTLKSYLASQSMPSRTERGPPSGLGSR